MGKGAEQRSKRTTTEFSSEDPALEYLAGFDAKTQLLAASVSIGWKLAIMILIPIFIGVKLDEKFDTAPSLSLAAFFIAIFGASVIISKAYKEINAQTAESINKSAKSKRGKK